MQSVSEYLITYGYLFLFLYSFGGGFIGLVVASIFAYEGSMQIEIVILVAFVANFVGDNFLVFLAKHQRKEFYTYLHKHKRKLALCKLWIKKYEYQVVFLQKFVYGIKTLIPIAIGLSKYSLKKFTFLNFFASALWAITIGFFSYYSSSYILNFLSFFDDKSYLPFLIFAGIIIGFLSLVSKIAEKKMYK